MMQRSLETALAELRGKTHKPVVTIGNFDGVHLGHRAIIDEIAARASALGTTSVALTFEPHPVTFFRKLPADTFRLTSPAHKLDLLQQLGIHAPVALPFEEQLFSLTPEAFVQTILKDVLDAAEVRVGYDFNFGKGRSGTPEDLARIARPLGINVDVHAPVAYDDSVVSSTRIRAALEQGELDLASSLLGRLHSVRGRVQTGAARGRTLGFPTLNIQPGAGMMVPHGVYLTTLSLVGDVHSYPAITNVGVKPTFASDDDAPNVETFVLDGLPLDADLYDTHVEVHFEVFRRPERRFDSVEALKDAVHDDIHWARSRHGIA